jgi:hypothetical protein
MMMLQVAKLLNPQKLNLERASRVAGSCMSP